MNASDTEFRAPASPDNKLSLRQWRLLLVGSILLAVVMACGLGFFWYEEFTYGETARNFPKDDIATLLNHTEAELNVSCKDRGYETDWNPFLGGYVVKIQAPRGKWLVGMVFNAEQVTSDYHVLYSNMDSVLYHNKQLR